jgi:hypothetical protein
MQNARILTGWKQIANHLCCGVRTVQRWEMAGLPVHRPKLTMREAVIAFAEELDAWMEAGPVRIDMIRDLQAKVASLEVEVRALKSMLAKCETAASNKQMRIRAQEMREHATDMSKATSRQREELHAQRRAGLWKSK